MSALLDHQLGLALVPLHIQRSIELLIHLSRTRPDVVDGNLQLKIKGSLICQLGEKDQQDLHPLTPLTAQKAA